jgi:hypothetical protein
MTNDLPTKATALLDARGKMPDEALDMALWDAVNVGGPALKFFSLAANTAPEIVTGFQQLLKEKDALIQTLEDENEMLTESNEHLVQCEGERNDLRKLVQRMEEVLSQLDQELGCNSAYLLSTREIVAQVVAEARAAIPVKAV